MGRHNLRVLPPAVSWSYLPLFSYLPRSAHLLLTCRFNIWSVFEVSAETGIGVGGVPRDTAYRLYRDGTQLRGIFPGDAQNARDVCALAPGC